MLNESKITQSRLKGSLRLAVALVFAILVALIAMGAVDADALEAAVLAVLGIASIVVAWWKDNDMTIHAIMRKMLGTADMEEIEEIDEDRDGQDRSGM